jgi:hypothetical protein
MSSIFSTNTTATGLVSYLIKFWISFLSEKAWISLILSFFAIIPDDLILILSKLQKVILLCNQGFDCEEEIAPEFYSVCINNKKLKQMCVQN